MLDNISGNSGLQSSQSLRSSDGGSDLLASLGDRVSSALDRAGGGATSASSALSTPSSDEVKRLIAGIAGGSVPGMNFNSIV
jgi:hypothetical protein